ncbi:DUF4395 domain-containing protein [Streptomyces botrytidirepellens]|uniref:DUF4395 domain-containing protein n=1 Tax=Streptomyces botrytidirepellens TaxID=2486417 RepID=A0A3M8S935_9ACTN|nr:DUF4395 domain-containing protein [Streptomyces botrytidirepellens]RNF77638.1 DUF4395 domain-containing protein [Streptomyces botrytidirepellens]
MQIDPRGPRFAAALTTLVLCAVLITGSGVLLAAQTAVFALGALAGLRYSPYGWLYRVALRPRLSAPGELEDARPPRFAQGVGAVFGIVGTVGYLGGAPWLGMAATGLALAAAFLNAAFGYCLGCEMYVLIRRVRSA